jgi:hypothetical protein
LQPIENEYNYTIPYLWPLKNEKAMTPVADSFIVQGGRRLKGSLQPQGAKNEALQILSACRDS